MGFMLISSLLATDSFAGPVTADFNGDGYQDLVVGVSAEDFSGLYDAGAVKVVYGRSSGRMDSYSSTEYIHQGKYGEPGINLYGSGESSDTFGKKISVGDFNNDGYDDLAVSTPNEKIGSSPSAGLVNIIYGSSSGLTRSGNHTLDLLRYKYGAYFNDYNRFGTGMAVGDYDGDGVDDLAVSFQGSYQYPEEVWVRGGVAIFFGDSQKGLNLAESSAKTHVFLEPWKYSNQGYGYWGQNLASGDFNNDGKSDLAIGSPYEKIAGVQTGIVHIAWGRSDWNGIPRSLKKIEPVVKENGGAFGAALATGNLFGDGRDELVIGMPGADQNRPYRSGMIAMVKFTSTSMTQSTYHQNYSLIPGSSTLHSRFGSSLNISDFNGDGKQDLAIGIPRKTKDSYWSWKRIENYGEVAVLFSNGSTFYKGSVWHQDSTGVEGGREDHDMFGATLSSGDFNNDGIVDLLIGATGEDIGSIYSAGSVQLIWGNSNGLTASIPGKQLFHQGSFSGHGFGAAENERYDRFGSALP